MTIEEHLNRISQITSNPLIREDWTDALESITALREQIAEMEWHPSRIKLATFEKQRDEAEDDARILTEETRVLRQQIAALTEQNDQLTTGLNEARENNRRSIARAALSPTAQSEPVIPEEPQC